MIKAKADAGWIDSYTPPEGFTVDNEGRPTPSTLLVAVVQSVVGKVSHTDSPPVQGVPPLPALSPVIETTTISPPSQAGMPFNCSVQRRSDSSSISSVKGSCITMNSQPSNEAYDYNGNLL